MDGKIIVFENYESIWEDYLVGPIKKIMFSPSDEYLLGISLLGILKVWTT